jgi:predicted lipoprotein
MTVRIQTLLLLIGFLACSCVPWTVVPLQEDSSAGRFEPSAYVESIWESRLLPYARESALPAASVRPGEGGGKALFLSGEGRVLEVETRGRTGRLSVDLPPGDGKPDLVIVTGPVIFGTALRDAAEFIEFSQFRNQLEYADVANELNRRAAESVAGFLDQETLPGRTLRFCGAWDGSGAVIEVVPLDLELR